jgi:hypothetical protein
MTKKIYIGDSVYAEYDGFGIVLTTENGRGPSNTIYMEPEVVRALVDFVDFIGRKPAVMEEKNGRE